MNEFAVANADELADGQLKEVKAGDTDVLLARVGDTVYAVGSQCPHYQAPLAKGLLCGHRLYCPWHHSSFDIRGGTLLDPPSLDGLPTYPVQQRDGQIWVEIPEHKTPLHGNPDPEQMPADDRTVVILGGGAAGYFTAQTLREQQFSGRIVLITREQELPYDRPKLSKNYLSGQAPAEKVPLRKEAYYEQYAIEVQVNTEAVRIDANAHAVQFADGDAMHYHALVAATGSVPSRLDVPGANKAGVFVLRTFADAEQIVDQLPEKGQVVVVGGSFIGLEVAASLRARAIPVTVVAPETVLFEKILGPEIGQLFQKLHEDNGVTFRLGVNVASLDGDDRVTAVVLDNGDRLPADLVVAGIGVKPNTTYLNSLPLNEKDHSVSVDTYLQAAPDLYAVGDIARFPNSRNHDQPTRIEHWRTAQQHGITAALNILGQQKSLHESVPFFWTNQYEKRLSYVGHAEKWDDIIIHGNPKKQDFVAFYTQDDRILAVASMNQDQASMAAEELMRRDAMPRASAVRDQFPDLTDLARKLPID